MCHFVRLAAFLIVATFSLQVAGCESSSASRSPVSSSTDSAGVSAARVSQQLIIKFKPKTVPCTAQGVARFAKASDVTLEWLRPMSGDACVVSQEAATPSELVRGQEKLKKHADIEWVEIDALMQRH